mmetsp:Transcript_32083/g.89809  ORF Transcript_32083/g.89809 Transcript_32083/m.89809 type:complete len:554 (-) Transcript_32083:192-1853(-)
MVLAGRLYKWCALGKGWNGLRWNTRRYVVRGGREHIFPDFPLELLPAHVLPSDLVEAFTRIPYLFDKLTDPRGAVEAHPEIAVPESVQESFAARYEQGLQILQEACREYLTCTFPNVPPKLVEFSTARYTSPPALAQWARGVQIPELLRFPGAPSVGSSAAPPRREGTPHRLVASAAAAQSYVDNLYKTLDTRWYGDIVLSSAVVYLLGVLAQRHRKEAAELFVVTHIMADRRPIVPQLQARQARQFLNSLTYHGNLVLQQQWIPRLSYPQYKTERVKKGRYLTKLSMGRCHVISVETAYRGIAENAAAREATSVLLLESDSAALERHVALLRTNLRGRNSLPLSHGGYLVMLLRKLIREAAVSPESQEQESCFLPLTHHYDAMVFLNRIISVGADAVLPQGLEEVPTAQVDQFCQTYRPLVKWLRDQKCDLKVVHLLVNQFCRSELLRLVWLASGNQTTSDGVLAVQAVTQLPLGELSQRIYSYCRRNRGGSLLSACTLARHAGATTLAEATLVVPFPAGLLANSHSTHLGDALPPATSLVTARYSEWQKGF